MLEDTRIGLSFLLSAAGSRASPTPLARAFLRIGGAICGEDFMRTGRTLAAWGSAGSTGVGLQTLLREGFT